MDLTSGAWGEADFFPVGVPFDSDVAMPLTPERAVVEVARATGVLVTEIPVLFGSRVTTAKQSARWRVVLDRQVSIETIEGNVRTDTLYASAVLVPLGDVQEGWDWRVDSVIDVASQVQPSADTLRYPIPSTGEVGEVIVPVLPGHPISFVTWQRVQ